MRFYLPDWDDRVDPGYDFLTDKMTLGRDPQTDDLYAHELFEEPIYDGLLVSRMALEGTQKKRARVYAEGARAYLRLPRSFDLFGDCGAFGYIERREPSFDTEEVAAYYDALGFDYGVSVDHIVVPEFSDQRSFRYELTLRNAEAFLRVHRAEGMAFTPVGSVQGWDAHTYSEAASALVQMGYHYVAIGGLARSNSSEVSHIVSEVVRAVGRRARVHVFGVARASMLPLFASLGVSSVDSAAPLRQAWLAARDNYYTMDGAFAAIRIPIARDDRGRPRTLIGRSRARFRDLLEAEQGALNAVRLYARRRKSLAGALSAVIAYDSMLADRREDRDTSARHRMYRETLKARPWERCGCSICRAIGVEVVVFRGSNRNRRRGFHNLWVLRRRLERASDGHHRWDRDQPVRARRSGGRP